MTTWIDTGSGPGYQRPEGILPAGTGHYSLDDPMWLSGRPTHCAPDGRPISLREYQTLSDDRAVKHVGFTELIYKKGRRLEISTVWLGSNLNMNFHDAYAPPVIFETMIFAPPDSGLDGEQWRYTTREAARQGHAEVVYYAVKSLIQVRYTVVQTSRAGWWER